MNLILRIGRETSWGLSRFSRSENGTVPFWNREVILRLPLKHLWGDDHGGLTFEWILLITVLVIGIVGGFTAVRDAVVDELGDVVGAIIAVDQSFATEGPPCAPCCGMGSYCDDSPSVQRERPDDPPISQD